MGLLSAIFGERCKHKKIEYVEFIDDTAAYAKRLFVWYGRQCVYCGECWVAGTSVRRSMTTREHRLYLKGQLTVESVLANEA